VEEVTFCTGVRGKRLFLPFPDSCSVVCFTSTGMYGPVFTKSLGTYEAYLHVFQSKFLPFLIGYCVDIDKNNCSKMVGGFI
jgi:hypothetical protein